MRRAAALFCAATAVAATPAASAEFGLLTLACRGDIALAADAPSEAEAPIAFETTVIFADGELLALVDPETGKPGRPLSPDALTRGSLEIVGREPWPMVWISATGRKATLIGFALKGDASLVSLTIRGPGPDGARAFTLFDSRGGGVHRGLCR